MYIPASPLLGVSRFSKIQQDWLSLSFCNIQVYTSYAKKMERWETHAFEESSLERYTHDYQNDMYVFPLLSTDYEPSGGGWPYQMCIESQDLSP